MTGLALGVFTSSLLLINSYFFGRICVRGIRNSADAHSILYLLAGLSFFNVLFVLLGFFQLLYSSVLIFFFSFATALSVYEMKPWQKRKRPVIFWIKSNTATVVPLTFCAAFSFSTLVKYFLPIEGYDALAYHIYQPYFFLNFSHTFDPNFLIPNAGLTIGYQSIVGWLISLGDIRGVSIFNLLLIGLIVCYQDYKLRNRKIVFRTLSGLSILFVILSSGATSVSQPSSDVFLAFYFIVLVGESVSIKTVVDARKIYLLIYLCLSALFIKTTALFGVVPLIIYLVYVHRTKVKTPGLRNISISIILGSFTQIIWYALNWFKTGNPFYPLFNSVFKPSNYSREVVTIEDEVKSTFNQISGYLESNSFATFFGDVFGLQLVLPWILILLSFWALYNSGIHLKKILLLLPISVILMYLTAAPLYRYSLYILVSLVFLISFSKVNSNGPKSLRIVGAPKVLAPMILAAILLYFQPVVTKTFIDNNTVRTNSEVRTNENDFNLLLTFLLKDQNLKGTKRFGIIGEGRAQLFQPHEVYVVPFDRRNPFSNSTITSLADMNSRVRSCKIDYLIVTERWGIPLNVDPRMLNLFYDGNQNAILYNQNGWKVFDVKKMV